MWAKGKALRNLFARALVYGGVSNPRDIWTRFQLNFCDDLERMIEMQEFAVSQGLADPHLKLGLYLLQRELQSLGKSLETYSMPLPSPQWNLGGGHPQTMHIEQFDPAGEEVLYNTLSSSLNTS